MNTQSEINFTILSLLPFSQEAELLNKKQKIDNLYFLKVITDLSITALEAFSKGHLSDFDAQVGENLCQIRAYKILNLSYKWLKSQETLTQFQIELDKIKNYKQILEEVIYNWEHSIKHSIIYNKNLDETEKIPFFLMRHRLLMTLSDDFIFIIIAWFLTHFNVREDNIPVSINLDYIARALHISKYRAKRLTHKYQQLICQIGSDFIVNISHDLSDKWEFGDILPKVYKIADENRAVLPCFLASEVIFYHNICRQIPILLIVKRIDKKKKLKDVIYFSTIGDIQHQQYQLISKPLTSTPYCLIVSGIALHTEDSIEAYIDHFMQENPLKIILSNTASHPQYSGKKLHDLRENPYLNIDNDEKIKAHQLRLISMRNIAIEKGYSRENQQTFFLRHIYANQFEIEKKQLENKYRGRVFNANDVQ